MAHSLNRTIFDPDCFAIDTMLRHSLKLASGTWISFAVVPPLRLHLRTSITNSAGMGLGGGVASWFARVTAGSNDAGFESFVVGESVAIATS